MPIIGYGPRLENKTRAAKKETFKKVMTRKLLFTLVGMVPGLVLLWIVLDPDDAMGMFRCYATWFVFVVGFIVGCPEELANKLQGTEDE